MRTIASPLSHMQFSKDKEKFNDIETHSKDRNYLRVTTQIFYLSVV